jgi:uncharacterized membrane protein YfcA
MPPEYALVPIAFLTSVLAGVMGMGGGVLLIAAMPGLVPAAAIFPLHACAQLASNVSRAAFGWRHLEMQFVPALLAGALLGAWLGGEVYASLDLFWLPAIVGVLILVLTWVPVPQVRRAGAPGLLLLGFYQTGLGMVAGATGPLGAAVLLQHSSQRDWLVVNTALYMSISHAVRVGAFVLLGFSFSPWWPLLLALLLAVIAGSWTGTRLRAHIPAVNFHRWFRLLVTVLALRMIAMPLLDL